LPSVSSLEEASELLAEAHEHERRLRIGDDLTTDGLDRILEHEAGDLTCTVEAGIRLSQLNGELARHGQRLSLDPPGDPTIGALLACNLSGPLRHRFGAPRDLVLGVTLVLADGTIASAGGKVVKNVAGYDLARLVCGSQGRLALIARASFRLHPLAKSSHTLLVEASDDDTLARSVAALLRSQLQASALDVLHPGRLTILFEGSLAAVESQTSSATSLLEDAGCLVTQCHKAAIWDESRARQGAARGRLRFAPGDLASALPLIAEAVIRPAAGVAYLPVTAPDDTPPEVRRLEDAIRARLDPNGVLA
jgi:glycolate dehydrogenase FAD-binding subunit